MLNHYFGNAAKAKQAMVEAELDNRSVTHSCGVGLCALVSDRKHLRDFPSKGAKADPNLARGGGRLYHLLTVDRMKEIWEKKEQLKSKVVPLASDPRPEAKELLRRLLPICTHTQLVRARINIDKRLHIVNY